MQVRSSDFKYRVLRGREGDWETLEVSWRDGGNLLWHLRWSLGEWEFSLMEAPPGEVWVWVPALQWRVLAQLWHQPYPHPLDNEE